VGGLSATAGGEARVERDALPRLRAWATHRLGDDLVLSGELRWTGE